MRRGAPSRISCGALLTVLAVALGCASAYDKTYQRETQRLESQEQSRQAWEEKAHAEARKFAAVVYFDTGSSVIREGAFRELDWFAEQLRAYPKAIIEVRGFADVTGGDSVNQKLSSERAKNVARYLATRGIGKERISPLGFASEFPAEANATTEGRQKNRRVEVTVR